MPEAGAVDLKHYADPWFWECVMASIANRDFVENWERLLQTEAPRSRIRDARTNKHARRDWLVERFLGDVKELIYDRVARP